MIINRWEFVKRVGIVALFILLGFLFLAGCSKGEQSGMENNSDNGVSDVVGMGDGGEGEDFPLSPRTSVNGILAKPERDWAAIIVMDNNSAVELLTSEDGEQAFRILSAMEAELVSTPFHYEAQSSDPLFTVMIEYADDPGTGEVIYSTESGLYYYRLTDTVGDQDDKGYVGGFSEELYEILAAYFQE